MGSHNWVGILWVTRSHIIGGFNLKIVQLKMVAYKLYGYGSIPINTIFSGMNIHLPAILMFTRGTRFWHTAIYDRTQMIHWWVDIECGSQIWWELTRYGIFGSEAISWHQIILFVVALGKSSIEEDHIDNSQMTMYGSNIFCLHSCSTILMR